MDDDIQLVNALNNNNKTVNNGKLAFGNVTGKTRVAPFVTHSDHWRFSMLSVQCTSCDLHVTLGRKGIMNLSIFLCTQERAEVLLQRDAALLHLMEPSSMMPASNRFL